MKIELYDNATRQQITRDMTADELATNDLMLAENEARLKTEADKAKAKQSLLDRLGITADEAALLLG